MSLFTLPVTAADIAQLETGIQFFQSSASNQAAVVAAINAPLQSDGVYVRRRLAEHQFVIFAGGDGHHRADVQRDRYDRNTRQYLNEFPASASHGRHCERL